MSDIRLSILPAADHEPRQDGTADPLPGSFAWYQHFLQTWAIKEWRAAQIKRAEYLMRDDVFAQLHRMAERSQITPWQAWLAGLARHDHPDVIGPDTPPEVARKRLADVYGYVCLGLALLEAANYTPPRTPHSDTSA